MRFLCPNPTSSSAIKCPYATILSFTVATSLLKFSHFIFLHSPWKSNHTYSISGSFICVTSWVNLSPMRYWLPFLSIRLTKYCFLYSALVSEICFFATWREAFTSGFTTTGGAHFRVGFMLQSRGIEPRIYKCEAIVQIFLSLYVIICSVSQKLAAAPSLSRPLTINLRPGLRQSLREMRAKFYRKLTLWIATNP